MKYSKKEAWKVGKPYGEICPFHLEYPDQQAITETCPDCVYVRDLCGCDGYETCEECKPIIKNPNYCSLNYCMGLKIEQTEFCKKHQKQRKLIQTNMAYPTELEEFE